MREVMLAVVLMGLMGCNNSSTPLTGTSRWGQPDMQTGVPVIEQKFSWDLSEHTPFNEGVIYKDDFIHFEFRFSFPAFPDSYPILAGTSLEISDVFTNEVLGNCGCFYQKKTQWQIVDGAKCVIKAEHLLDGIRHYIIARPVLFILDRNGKFTKITTPKGSDWLVTDRSR